MNVELSTFMGNTILPKHLKIWAHGKSVMRVEVSFLNERNIDPFLFHVLSESRCLRADAIAVPLKNSQLSFYGERS